MTHSSAWLSSAAMCPRVAGIWSHYFIAPENLFDELQLFPNLGTLMPRLRYMRSSRLEKRVQSESERLFVVSEANPLVSEGVCFTRKGGQRRLATPCLHFQSSNERKWAAAESQPAVRQEKGPRQSPARPVPWCLTQSLQNCICIGEYISITLGYPVCSVLFLATEVD